VHFVLSALLLCSFVVLLLVGLASVLRDLVSHDLRPLIARAPHAVGAPASSTALDLDLPRDLDHPLRR
jgi:hypothetical protein